MKKTLILSICALLIGVTGTWVVIKMVAPQLNRSAENNTYWQVTAKLDQGGEVFGYLYTEKITEAFLGFLTRLEKKLATMEIVGQAKMHQAFSMLNMMLKGYGLEEISGLGFSSITLKPGLHRNRVVIYHRPGFNKGLIWNVTGLAPRYLDEIGLLAENTALAFFSDYNIEKLAAWIGQQGKNMSGPKMDQGLAMMKMSFAAAGIDGDRLLKSYGGCLGFLLILDPEKRVTIPLPGSPISIPEPAISILIKVNDSYLFDLIRDKLAALGKAQVKDEDGVKKIIFPRLPVPLPLEPNIAQKGNWLLVASMGSVVQSVFGSGDRRLSESEEFKAMAYKMPRRGNGFGYISPVLPHLLAQIIRENKALFPTPAAMEKIASVLIRSKGLCEVWENSATGLLYTINHGFEISTLVEFMEAFIEIAKEKKLLQTEAVPAMEAPAKQ